ncbi:GIY-YIG nuclease family protein [Marinimicrobium sp. C2-29]|uniref:GIY-YIG nuclease family protein n=1 Tax=Marinimicrobium sp. C2-29 TaxID=3139825 RepID=UPI003138CAB7
MTEAGTENSQSSWYVYIILGDDECLYTGITTDIARRWREHTSGPRGARYFRGRRPRELCYLEPHPDRSSASRREWQIKQLTRAGKEQLIAAHPKPRVPELS